ncbi:MAG: hypothetical protein RL514_71 [Verrucomicrobiota bacterium]|jgi:hypothetical protein
MKPFQLFILLALLALPVSACRKQRSPAESSADAAKSTAPEPLDLAKLNAKIREYTEAFGKPPASLQEMVDKKFLPRLPEAPAGRTLVYDAHKMQAQLQ